MDNNDVPEPVPEKEDDQVPDSWNEEDDSHGKEEDEQVPASWSDEDDSHGKEEFFTHTLPTSPFFLIPHNDWTKLRETRDRPLQRTTVDQCNFSWRAHNPPALQFRFLRTQGQGFWVQKKCTSLQMLCLLLI